MITPESDDVLSGQGRSNQSHPGNLRYHEILDRAEKEFVKTKCRTKKQKIAQDAIEEVQTKGRFLKFDHVRREWSPLSESEVYAKVSQALRYRRRIVMGQNPLKVQAKYPSIEDVLSKRMINKWQGFDSLRRINAIEAFDDLMGSPIEAPSQQVTATNSGFMGSSGEDNQPLNVDSFDSLFDSLNESTHFSRDDLLAVLKTALDPPPIGQPNQPFFAL